MITESILNHTEPGPTLLDPYGKVLPSADVNGIGKLPVFQNEPLTDASNARRFVRDNGSELRYCKQWGKWLVWEGKRWAIDATDRVMLLAKRTIIDMYKTAVDVTDSGERSMLMKHAILSESESHLRSMISLAQSEPGIPVRPYELDRDIYLLNCGNGTIDLRTAELRCHDSRDLITKLVPVDYDSGAKCPKFVKMIGKLLGRNRELIDYIQKCVGYSLTGDVSEQVLFFLYGDGSNGKTTFLEAVRGILGDYGGQIPMESLMMKNTDGITNDIAQLKGLRFVTSTEVEQGRRLAESKVKMLTGGGMLQGRFLYQELFQFSATHKIFMDGNHKPQILGSDQGIWRRMKLIPFTVTIQEQEKDKSLAAKLKEELPGILQWALEGCVRWQREGLKDPTIVAAEVAGYRAEMDRFPEFLEDCCDLGKVFESPTSELYAAYGVWCKDQLCSPISTKSFAVKLRQAGALPLKKAVRSWKGIRLKPTETV